MNKFKIGETIICEHDYAYIPRGTKVQVVAITGTGSLKLYGFNGTYKAHNFKKIDRQGDEPLKQSSLYVAFEISAGKTLSGSQAVIDFGNHLRNGGNLSDYQVITAGTSTELKNRINVDLMRNPNHKWIILFGHTVAEIKMTPSTVYSSIT